MWGIPAFAQAYVQPIEGIMRSAPSDVALDFPAQFAKVGHALITGAPLFYPPPGITGDLVCGSGPRPARSEAPCTFD